MRQKYLLLVILAVLGNLLPLIVFQSKRKWTMLQVTKTTFDAGNTILEKNSVYLTPSVNLSQPLTITSAKLQKCRVNLEELKEERFTIMKNSTVGVLWNSELKDVIYGGKYEPSDCKADQNLAVIIPYRDRKEQLEILTNSLHAFLQKQKLRYTIYVVELALPTRYNKGILLNIGFNVSQTMSKHDCYVFHDVDLIPMNEKNLYRCTATPKHLGSANSKYSYKLPYPDYVGGVVMIQSSQFKLINGFSNAYFGWGGEDDDYGKRLLKKGLRYDRPSPKVGKYYALFHGADASNPKNPERQKALSEASSRQMKEGLNSINFKVLAIEFRPWFTWIYVQCNELEVMSKMPK